MSFTSSRATTPAAPGSPAPAAPGSLAPPAPGSLAPNWRDVYLAAGARAISGAGDLAAATALALTLQARGGGGTAVAALLLASAAPVMLLGRAAGWLADHIDSRTLMIAVGTAQTAVCAALAFVDDLPAMIALVALLAAGLAVTQPTLGALVPEMVGMANLPRAMAIGQVSGALGLLAGPALGGLLVGWYGIRTTLLADAATYLAIVAVGLLIRTRRKAGSDAAAVGGDGPAATAVGWRLRQDRLLARMLAATAAVIGVLTAVNVIDVFFVRETLGASEAMYGVVSAVWMAGLVGGGLLARRLDQSDAVLLRTLMMLLTATSTVIVITSLIPNAMWLIPLNLIGGVLNGGENVVAALLINRRAPAAHRGRAIGTFSAAINGASVAGYLAGGALLTQFPPRPLVTGTGLAALLVCVWFLGQRGIAGRGVAGQDVRRGGVT